MRFVWSIVAVAAIAGWGGVAHSQEREGRRIALVVGIDNFRDAEWPNLRYAAKDASDLANVLASDFDEVLQPSESDPGLATVSNLFAQLEKLNTSDADTVLIYISSHGTLVRDARGELVRLVVMNDTDARHPLSTGLLYSDLLRRLDGLRSKHKVLILAACHAGAGKSVLSADLRHELRGLKGAFFAEPMSLAGEGRLIIAASAWGEPAREDDKLKNDVYTHFFIEALGGFDRNGDGAISALEAHDFARTRTMEFTQNRQRPTLSAEIVGEDPMILIGQRERNGDPIIAAYSPSLEGARLEVDGRYKGVLPGGFVVEPGSRHVRVIRPEATEPILDRHLAMESDSPLILDTLIEPDPLTITPSVGFAWQFTHGSVANRYLPAFPRLDLSLELTRPNQWWRAGMSLGGSIDRQSIRVPSGAQTIATKQDLKLVHLSGHIAAEVWRRAWVTVALQFRAGWSIGERRLDLTTVARRTQRVSFLRSGAGVELEFWPLNPVGLRVSSSVEIIGLRVEGKTHAVASQVHGLSLLWAW